MKIIIGKLEFSCENPGLDPAPLVDAIVSLPPLKVAPLREDMPVPSEESNW